MALIGLRLIIKWHFVHLKELQLILVCVRAALTILIYYSKSLNYSNFQDLFVFATNQLIHVWSVWDSQIPGLLRFFLGDLWSVFKLGLVAVIGVDRVAGLVSSADALSVAHKCNWDKARLVLWSGTFNYACLNKSHRNNRVSEATLKLLLQV